MAEFTHLHPWAGSKALNAGTAVTIHTIQDTSRTVYVTKIVMSVITHADGKATTFQDSAASPVAIGSYNDHADATNHNYSADVQVYDFGTTGIALTTGKNFEAVGVASGTAGVVYAEGYEK